MSGFFKLNMSFMPCGADSIPLGYKFSPVISDLVFGNHNNILFNQLWEKQTLFPMNLCYPSMDTFSCSMYPMQSTGYDYLLNPQLAINQVSQNMQNGGGFWGSTNGVNTPFWNGGQIQWPWQQKPGDDTSGGSKNTQADKDLATLKDIFAKLKKASVDDNGRFLSDDLIKEYDDALKLKTSQEKVDAIKKVIEKIDAEHIREAVYEDKDIRKSLAKLGFKFPDTPAFKAEKEDKICSDTARKLKHAIEQKDAKAIEGILCCMKGVDDGKTLAYISAWYKLNPQKSMIKEVAALLPEAQEEQTEITGAIKALCDVLIDKADKYNNSEISKKVRALNTTLIVINEATRNNTTVTDDDLVKVSAAFDKLYAAVRLAEAAKIDKEIKTKYSYLNEVKEGSVPENEITGITKEELKKELGEKVVSSIGEVDEVDETSEVTDPDEDDEVEDDESEEADGTQESSSVKKKTPYEMGSKVYDIINGASDELEYPTVDKYISSKNLNKDNVIDFLSGFYSHGSHEGIIEYLDDEHDGGAIKMENKKNIIKSLIAKAKKEGLRNDDRVLKLERILEMYTNGDYKDKENFNNGGSWFDFSHGFWKGLASCVGDTTTHNEIIDKLMKSLWAELKVE